jgi:hypothetical protein
MAPAAGEFSAPGAVSYDSNTQVVGDGTWDFDKNTFLLPNLQGTNFETTRYNGILPNSWFCTQDPTNTESQAWEIDSRHLPSIMVLF